MDSLAGSDGLALPMTEVNDYTLSSTEQTPTRRRRKVLVSVPEGVISLEAQMSSRKTQYIWHL